MDWLVDSRHDVHIEGPVIEAGKFDTYALRHVITRELARTFGLEIYVNSECQKPCGKWADRVLLEVAPDSWALVDNKLTRQAEAARFGFHPQQAAGACAVAQLPGGIQFGRWRDPQRAISLAGVGGVASSGPAPTRP